MRIFFQVQSEFLSKAQLKKFSHRQPLKLFTDQSEVSTPDTLINPVNRQVDSN